MASKLSAAQKQLLKEYGRLYKIHHNNLYKVNIKPEFDQVKKEMERQKLTHEDYIEYERMNRYLRTANELIEEEKKEKANESAGIAKIVIGVLLMLVGIGLSADTNFLFYGAIFSGIGLIAYGAMDIYYKKY